MTMQDILGSFDWESFQRVLTYDPEQPLIFSSGLFLFMFLAFSFVYMLLQRALNARLVFGTLGASSPTISTTKAAASISSCWPSSRSATGS